MASKEFLVLLCGLLALFSTTAAATKRQANVRIINYTGRTMGAVSLVHKYSDVYESSKEWGLLPNNHHSSLHTVSYNTGWFTTGRDWWVVTWFDETLQKQYYTDPDNFRDVLDVLEAVGPTALAFAGAAAGTVVLGGPTGFTLGMGIGRIVSSALLNTATTAGFKQHILRSEDEGEVVSIYLYSDGRVKITSPSGTSWTKYSVRNTQ